MTIREMTMDDIEAVAAMEAADSQTPWDETSLFTYFLREDAILLVAVDDEGGLRGFAALLAAPPESDVLDITVAKPFRNQGIGAALLTALADAARERGVDSLYLEVRVGNAPARHLYEKLGFCEIGLRKHYYTNPVEDGVVMQWRRN